MTKKVDKSFPKITSNQLTTLSPWVTLSAKNVSWDSAEKPSVFHSFQQADYVTMLGVRPDGLIPIVKQFRPAVEEFTLELPGGLLDRNDAPENIAIGEMREETGHNVLHSPTFLGCLYPDTGRLENRFWAYFSEVSPQENSDWNQEPGIEVILVTRNELREMILDGRFKQALHISVIGLALTKGLFKWS
ncbi:NUDIX hydrolase [Thalassospira sp.]|uniref:NUDIX hydrolase n=1 Tax=Thalassospira sp. TaxID=1912094 RepID=UPI000C545038|nr:NUDIX hydrolase [Thalassospira sp.]MBC07618.1 NUDIX hydrolase [Thalassospira sp.]|tara:strand:+ start:9451 stop:10017 length:567 start_codon:yes stop_codon:yes gene_type:complete